MLGLARSMEINLYISKLRCNATTHRRNQAPPQDLLMRRRQWSSNSFSFGQAGCWKMLPRDASDNARHLVSFHVTVSVNTLLARGYVCIVLAIPCELKASRQNVWEMRMRLRMSDGRHRPALAIFHLFTIIWNSFHPTNDRLFISVTLGTLNEATVVVLIPPDIMSLPRKRCNMLSESK